MICIIRSTLVAAPTFALALVACIALRVLQYETNPISKFTCSFQVCEAAKLNLNLNFAPKTLLKNDAMLPCQIHMFHIIPKT